MVLGMGDHRKSPRDGAFPHSPGCRRPRWVSMHPAPAFPGFLRNVGSTIRKRTLPRPWPAGSLQKWGQIVGHYPARVGFGRCGGRCPPVLSIVPDHGVCPASGYRQPARSSPRDPASAIPATRALCREPADLSASARLTTALMQEFSPGNVRRLPSGFQCACFQCPYSGFNWRTVVRNGAQATAVFNPHFSPGPHPEL